MENDRSRKYNWDEEEADQVFGDLLKEAKVARPEDKSNEKSPEPDDKADTTG